jgi:hypothetical protein
LATSRRAVGRAAGAFAATLEGVVTAAATTSVTF